MTVGIIYIARNDMRDSADHYKIGKSYKADPKIRMKELNEDTTLYIGEFVCKGHLLVNDVDECERIMHQKFQDKRINNSREFFKVRIEQIVTEMRDSLSGKIIQDHLPRFNPTSSNVSLIELIPNLQDLNFLKICKFAYTNNINAEFHGIPTSPFFDLINILVLKDEIAQKKNEFTQTMDEDQNLKELYSEISDHAYMRGRLLNPVYWSQECSNHYRQSQNYDSNSIKADQLLQKETIKFKKKVAKKLQKHILDTDMKTYFTELPYKENLLYLGVVLCWLEDGMYGGEDPFFISRKGITDFLIENVKRLFSHKSNFESVMDSLNRFSENNKAMVWSHMSILSPLFFN